MHRVGRSYMAYFLVWPRGLFQLREGGVFVIGMRAIFASFVAKGEAV